MVQKTCMDVSWSNCDARTFDVRVGPDYVPGQKQPSDHAIYNVFACDGFKMPSKINHIARFMDVKPYIEKHKTPYDREKWSLPPIIIINVMAPSLSFFFVQQQQKKKLCNLLIDRCNCLEKGVLDVCVSFNFSKANKHTCINNETKGYPPEMMSGKDNGEGYQLVFFAHLSDEVRALLNDYNDGKVKELPPSIRLFSDFIHSTPDSPLRQRFKCVARIMNLNHAGFSFLTKNLIAQYNGKPFLARTSSTFYHEPGKYFAVDIDAHLFGFPARKGLSYVKDLINNLVYDAGFIIEGHANHELPERVLCCARVSRIGIDRALSFPNDFVEIASNKDSSKSYSDLYKNHILKQMPSTSIDEDDDLQKIDEKDRSDKANMSVFSDANDEEAQRLLKEISLEEQKQQQQSTDNGNAGTTTDTNNENNTANDDKKDDKEDSGDDNDDDNQQQNANNNSYFYSWFSKQPET
ncbi:hypothetical protein RFI_07778 [Reticulomyxa filosa]|uniref:Protein ENHANCED DISEASE RESISTANCE 2 C-terminal domain-containing protein n=1 Tax=Reticulomyxa filosa TaxID=46433 RepID=X6NTR6_RETFI|nr:hypothetical protein RFI_07778 [Reticulomyxa filosa]|eukprot:ETO29348.1 hypothetical protein RFI_07778 [Reticulomyxa filosa]